MRRSTMSPASCGIEAGIGTIFAGCVDDPGRGGDRFGAGGARRRPPQATSAAAAMAAGLPDSARCACGRLAGAVSTAARRPFSPAMRRSARPIRPGRIGLRAMPTVRDATFDLFRAHGMTTMFGNPGSTELPMLADFPADFRYVLGLQEAVVVGMADGFAPGLRQDHGRQPPHRARRRQRDGGDLQRPGQPLAAADHRRPAGARADHPAGQPHQPRRDPDAAPAGQVVLRAAAGRGRAAGARPRRPPRRRCRRAARSSSRCRWTTGTPRSTRATRSAAIDAPGDRPRRRRPRGGARPRRARSTPPPTRSSSPAPTSTPAAPGTSPSPSPSASACRSGPRRRPAASASASPRATPTSAASCRRRSARSGRRSRATT